MIRMPPRKYKYKYKKKSRKTSFGRRRKVRTGQKTFYVTRESTRDVTSMCHQTISGLSTGIVTPFALNFQLGDMTGNAELRNLFDGYKITRVKFRFTFATDADYTAINPGYNPRISFIKDYNDSSAPSQSQMRQYANFKELMIKTDTAATRWFYLKPAALQMIYRTAATNATAPNWNSPFIDTQYSDVPYYGIKMGVDNLFTGGTIRVEAKITCAFRGIS